MVLKIDGASGEVLWTQHYASPEGVDEAFMSLALDSQDNVYVTGRAQISGQGTDIIVAKLYGTNGSIAWLDHLGGSALADDIGWDVAVGPDGNPVISGLLVQSGDQPYTLVRKLAAADGSLMWEELVSGAVNNIATRGCWLDVLSGGDLIACQRTFTSNGYDVMLQRYAALDGALVWDTLFDGPTHGGDDARAMRLDSNGDILVAGVQDAYWNYDFMALKFDHSDGSLVWNAGYDGPPGWYDVAGAITEGPEGSVVVTGLSDGSGTGWDWATVGFDGTDGSELWVHRFDGPNSQSDESRDVVCNGRGDIFVTGYGYGVGTSKDFVTIRYQVDTTSAAPETPAASLLARAWPNPFNPRVNIAFEMPHEAHASLVIHDLRGRVVKVLADEIMGAGTHTLQWDGRDGTGQMVASGTYLATVRTGDGQRVNRKLLLSK